MLQVVTLAIRLHPSNAWPDWLADTLGSLSGAASIASFECFTVILEEVARASLTAQERCVLRLGVTAQSAASSSTSASVTSFLVSSTPLRSALADQSRMGGLQTRSMPHCDASRPASLRTIFRTCAAVLIDER